MVELPENLKQYQKEAEEYLTKRAVSDIEFSGTTYQILVKDTDTNKECWVFLQLEGQGQLKDFFCSEDEEPSLENLGCVHIAAAYLSLFGSHAMPLHQRFGRSLWNQLCRNYEDLLGDDPFVLKKIKSGHYDYKSSQGKPLFSLLAKDSFTADEMDALIQNRRFETEETSLKFSNLTSEEILQWRQGRPNPQLRYELSYWCDLAKWLMKQQERGEPYEIAFQYSKKNLPNGITISFPNLQLFFYLTETLLVSIIPSLNTVESPLKVISVHEQSISHITYHKREGNLVVEGVVSEERRQIESEERKKGIPIEEWIYIPKKGFYTEEPHILLQLGVIRDEELSAMLSEHGKLISTFLTDCSIHFDPVPLSHHLYFDDNWNLHVDAFLFQIGDLTQGDSRLISDWVYLDEEGFYPIKEKRFDRVETIIPIYQVGDFVTHHRTWLNQQEGFQTHVRSLEYQISYSVTPSQRLTFARTLTRGKEGVKIQDFGSWVYLEGHGFYTKTSGTFSHLLKAGMTIGPDQIPLFIKTNRDELSLIPHFFLPKCPVSETSLKVLLTEKQHVKVVPQYRLIPEYEEKSFYPFDDFIYLEGLGFYELPIEKRLPEKFRFEVELEGEELDTFLTYEIDEISNHLSYVDPRIVKPKKIKLNASFVRALPEKKHGWYTFKLNYQSEQGAVSVVSIQKALKKKEVFVFSEAGLINLRDKRYFWLRQLPKDRFNVAEDTLTLTALDFMRLHAFDPIELVGEDPQSRELFEELVELQVAEHPNIEGLLSHLRPYQEKGVEWLWFLYYHQLSGLLCDDMGLGKTHQAMGLLASVYNLYRSYSEGTRVHFLIVCPTSVIYHWQEKLEEYLPRLKVCVFYGTSRSLQEFHEQHDILLTSYGILRNEKDILSQINFEVAIFDEIQIAKNQSSRIYATLLKMKAKMRLGLTGTPIENHLRELKSLFDIVLPSYMPSDADYREHFIKPIEKEHDRKRKDLLHRLIKPFVLRRKKEDVLRDLPDKIEEISHCDLSPSQRQLYMDVLIQRRRPLLEELQNKQAAVPYLHIFALLSSLKQICDHPSVFFKKPQDYKQYSSGKWDLFVELLREARESEQKIVVFSQYLNMLDIIEAYLEEENIGFAALRGSTVKRKEQIRRFNQDPSCEVFVGSLQAAGLGVDLTAGSVVIHYDRWWNAARENQATDRVHRIGQTRGVQVFKFVTKGTFEERIDAMITAKGQLMEDVIGIDDHETIKRFSRDELIDLLQILEVEEHPIVSDSD